VFRKSLVAALIGSSCGAAAAYWTPPSDGSINAPAVVVAPARAGVVPGDSSGPAMASQTGRDAMSLPGARDVVASDAVRRARELAQRPDVTALVALRDAVLRRVEESARKDDPSTTREIEAIDRYLAEARALRLRLDAAAFRKGT
jgi:hypothetical protein